MLPKERLRLPLPLPLRILHRCAMVVLSFYWFALFVGTHASNPGATVQQVNDKLLHFSAYAGLAFLIAAVLTAFRLRMGMLLASWSAAAIYGVVDELSQMLVANRTAEVGDWLADVSGASIGIAVFALLLVSTKRILAPWYDVAHWTSCP